MESHEFNFKTCFGCYYLTLFHQSFFTNSRMGYNSNCYYQSCYHDCCDYSGYCPTYSSGCYYYYNSSYYYEEDTSWIVYMIVPFACFFGFIILCACIRRCQQQRHQQAINMSAGGQGSGETIIIGPAGGYGQQPTNSWNVNNNNAGDGWGNNNAWGGNAYDMSAANVAFNPPPGNFQPSYYQDPNQAAYQQGQQPLYQQPYQQPPQYGGNPNNGPIIF